MIKVLVIDDEPTIAMLLADIIEDHGYEVTIALDGRQGYALAKNGKYQVVISDIMMPYVDGQELCARLKHEPSTQGIQVILMSAVAHMAQIDTNCLADAFILKPFDISVITQIIERFLSTPEMGQSHSLPLPGQSERVYFTQSKPNFTGN